MSKLTLPIQIGRKYVRRDGTVVTIKRAGHGNTVWVDNSGYVFTNTGRANCEDDRWCPHDLVANDGDQGHLHADSMALYAQDAAETAVPWLRWEWREFGNTPNWRPCTEGLRWDLEFEYRRKPKTIRIGEFDVPSPMTWDEFCVRPFGESETPVWITNLLGRPIDSRAISTGDRAVKSGIVHRTQEAAEQHATALLSLSATP